MLLKEAPQPSIDARDVRLGEVSDGIWLAERFPTVLRFGVIVELAMAPDESGSHRLSLLLSEARPQPGQFVILDETEVVAAPASAGHWTPRFSYHSFSISIEAPEAQEMLIWVALGDQLMGLKPLVVHPDQTLPSPAGWAP